MFIDTISITDLQGAEKYLSHIPALSDMQKSPLQLSSAVTMLVGENGTGKSTLIEAIACAMGFNAEGGTKNFTLNTANATSNLHEHLVIGRTKHPKSGFFLRAESFFNVATYVDDLGIADYYGNKSLHEQSHGESFISIIRNKFRGNGLYILDEPEAALSPVKQLILLAEMHDLVQENAQFIIATHSPILMSYPRADVILLSDDGIRHVDYKETDHYHITRRMINEPESVYKHLFERLD